MPAVYWKDAKDNLKKLVTEPRFGLFSDLDGTLAPIAPTAQAAHITPRNRQLLAELSRELPLVSLISGRRAASLQAKVDLPGLTYVGNHGLERWSKDGVKVLPAAGAFIPQLQAVRAAFEKIAEPGTNVEDKEATLSFHYRQAQDPLKFAKQHAAQIAEIVREHNLVLFTGKMVFEVRPPFEMDKGHAFKDLVNEHQIKAALFLGDDISDLTAFQAAKQMRAEKSCSSWGIGVQSEEAPAELTAEANYLATGVADVEVLLEFLLTARRASST